MSTPHESVPEQPPQRRRGWPLLGWCGYGLGFFMCTEGTQVSNQNNNVLKSEDEFIPVPSKLDRKWAAWSEARHTPVRMPEDMSGWPEYADDFVISSRIIERQFQRYVGDCVTARTVDDIINPRPDID